MCVCVWGVVVNPGTFHDCVIVCQVVFIIDLLFWACVALWTRVVRFLLFSPFSTGHCLIQNTHTHTHTCTHSHTLTHRCTCVGLWPHSRKRRNKITWHAHLCTRWLSWLQSGGWMFMTSGYRKTNSKDWKANNTQAWIESGISSLCSYKLTSVTQGGKSWENRYTEGD